MSSIQIVGEDNALRAEIGGLLEKQGHTVLNSEADITLQLDPQSATAEPLSARRQEIPQLVAKFIQRYNQELNRNFAGVEERAMRSLVEAPWRGGTRELQNIIERAVLTGSEPLLTEQDIRPIGQPPAMPVADTKDLKEAATAYERDHIRRIIAERNGDKRAAAKDLGISLSSLYRHLDLKSPI